MFNSNTIDSIKEQLIRTGQTVAVAESVTAGFLQAALASAENASSFFEGGITTYNIDQKLKHLGINRQEGEASNCVSEEIAREMALGACKLFSCDWGISITGYATPVPESDNKLFAYFAICNTNQVVVADKINLANEQPEEAQLKYVNMILETFNNVLIPQKAAGR